MINESFLKNRHFKTSFNIPARKMLSYEFTIGWAKFCSAQINFSGEKEKS